MIKNRQETNKSDVCEERDWAWKWPIKDEARRRPDDANLVIIAENLNMSTNKLRQVYKQFVR